MNPDDKYGLDPDDRPRCPNCKLRLRLTPSNTWVCDYCGHGHGVVSRPPVRPVRLQCKICGWGGPASAFRLGLCVHGCLCAWGYGFLSGLVLVVGIFSAAYLFSP